MKKTHRCVIGVLALPIVICTGSHSLAQQFELRIDVADSIHFVCEPIWLDAQLTNISEDTVRIKGFDYPGGGRFKVILTDERGDTLRLRYEGFYADWRGFVLSPGETHCEAFALAEVFFCERVTPPLPLYSRWAGSLAPGTYKAFAEYRQAFDAYAVRSAGAAFRVTEPTGAEREALELFLEVHKSVASFDDDKTSQLIAQFLATYPKSVYLERALMRVGNYEKLLQERPDSGYLGAYLNWTLKGIEDEEQKRTFLEGIIEEHPGTRVARFAEERLRRLRRGD